MRKVSRSIREVTAFACGQCNSIHVERVQAEKCCTCEKCGHKFPYKPGYGMLCGRCVHGSRIREARASLRRVVEDEARARKRLDELLAMKRPAAGSAPF